MSAVSFEVTILRQILKYVTIWLPQFFFFNKDGIDVLSVGLNFAHNSFFFFLEE